MEGKSSTCLCYFVLRSSSFERRSSKLSEKSSVFLWRHLLLLFKPNIAIPARRPVVTAWFSANRLLLFDFSDKALFGPPFVPICIDSFIR